MKKLQIILIALTIGLMPTINNTANAKEFTKAQKVEIEKIVKELLTKKDPSIVISAAQEYQAKEEAKITAKGKEAIKTESKNIFNNPTSPVTGNPKGNINIVEFFDYSCGYCKRAQETIKKILKEDKNVRFIFKELPIFGHSSIKVSKAALASVAQGKYVEFHMALMSSKKRLNEKEVMKIAKNIGLDTDKLKKEMNNPKIEAIIKENKELAIKLGVNGTPGFIIDKTLYAGAMPYKKMKEEIAKSRNAKK